MGPRPAASVGRTIAAMSARAPSLVCLVALLGCADPALHDPGAGSSPPVATHPWIGRDVLTQTVLHPDTKAARLYSINYQQGGIIPICTPVHVVALDDAQMTFTVGAVTYTYLFRSEFMVEGISVHLGRYFGDTCDRGDALPQVDRDGIAAGRVAPGMSKAGVIKAIGYPPPHSTGDLASPQWRYWKNRFDTFIVHFEGDTVVRVQE